MFALVLYWLFLLAVGVQLGYAFYFFVRVFARAYNVNTVEGASLPVSIIICAKNEAANLKKNLPEILTQKYSAGYEVIVVNDASTDDTPGVLQELELRYDNLWDVVVGQHVERDLQGKKFALRKGAVQAKYDWLLLTDADCVPASDKWLQSMAAPLACGREIVAGYGGYNRSGGLLNAFIRWETMHTFLQYSSYALAGSPYMAVGRNMACTKVVLEKAQHSEVWNALPSGDDDLLVSIAGNQDNVAIVAEIGTFTYSDAKATWKEWVQQKQRHLSTGKYYGTETKTLLGGYAMAHAALWLGFFWLLFTPYCLTALAFMAVRCLCYWAIWAATAYKLNEKKLVYLFPLFDLAWIVYNFAFFPYITWKNKKHWR